MINTFFITLLFSHALTWTQAIPTLSHPPTVWKRDGAPLFGASGMPSRDDIGQHEGDCGWLSSMAAITTISPFFVKSKFAYSSSSDQSVTDVRVTIFTDDASLTAQVVPVTYHSQLINNDNEDTSTAWWPGAYDSAAVYSGTLPSTNGSLNPVGVTNALQILTGKEAAWKFKGDLGDEAWEVLNKGTKTPVVLQTLPTGAVELVGGHAYAVLNTSIAVNGTKMVALFNPWGDDVVYTYDTAMNDCYLLAWLKNNDTLKSTESSSSSFSPPSSPLVGSGTFCSETDNGVSTSTSAESRSQSVRTLNYKDTSSSISSSFDPTPTSAPEGVEENIVWVTEMVVITKFVYD